MTGKPARAKQPVTYERRSGVDRRVAESSEKVKVERRRSIEPRSPEIVEIDMSESEWGVLNDNFKASS
jgi:hypothetical protein